jgi:transaldolase/glucose-6-phosphate isomerase
MDMSSNRIKQLYEKEGQSAWQDDISRDMLNEGTILTAIEETGVRGLTSNPTIFEKAIAAGTAYDEEIGGLLERDLDAHDIFEAVAVRDIQAATDLFRPLYDASEGGDGFVSIEVSPLGARDAAVTTTDARRLWSAVDRPNLMVKIPGTAEALPVIQQMLEEGININITLLFSVPAYERVARAYIAALKARQAAGLPIDRIASVASFFVSRVDTLVDKFLDERIEATSDATQKGWLESLKGKAAIANEDCLPIVREALFGSRVGIIGGSRSVGAETALGLDLSEKPGPPRHTIRRRVDRPAHCQHHASTDHHCLPRSWHGGSHCRQERHRSLQNDGGSGGGRDRH